MKILLPDTLIYFAVKKIIHLIPANNVTFYLIALTPLISIPAVARNAKSISFMQSSEYANVQQGSTQSLSEYISTSDNIPVSASLSARDGANKIPSWLSVDGSLLNGLKYTTNAEISFSFDATNLSVGQYSAVITATASGYTNATLNIFLTVSSVNAGKLVNIKVNFQDPKTTPPSGWLVDYGQTFGARTSKLQGSGNVYGWIKRSDNTAVDLTKNGRRRNSPSDVLQATFMHMQATDAVNTSVTPVEGIWQCQVANGNYKVTVSAGEGLTVDSRHTVNIEGVAAISNFVPTTSNRFKVATITVSVSDGYLTVDAKGGANTKINYIIIQPDVSKRPSIVSVNPQNSSININENSSVSTSILKLPNSGVNNSTLTSATVFLAEDATGTVVPSTVNGTAGGDAITLVPNDPLKLATTYKFSITSGVKDLSDSSFIPYSSTFSTGSSSTAAIVNVQFAKIALPNTIGQHSSLTIGPNHKLYALTIDGILQRFGINTDGTLQDPQLIYTLQDEYGSRKQTLCIGLAFDPAATASNLILWVTHSSYMFLNGPDWDGKLSKLTGANLSNIQDVVINLPRSKKDHLTNSIAFGPDKALYFTQACNSAMGKADNTWGNRDEHLLSGSCLRLDVSKITRFPLDAKTPEGGGTYNPYAANAPLTFYATGVRNAYDLLWHSNGHLYLPTNGSAAGGNTPASVAGTTRPDGTHYSGPSVPSLTDIQQTQTDFLFRVTKGGYYGHPNPLRGEYVMNGGNPTSSIDPAEVNAYPLGTKPDANYRGYSYNFQVNKSPDGIIEYKSSTFNGALKGKIMVVRYSANNDILTLTPGGANGDIVSSVEGAYIKGFSGFKDPLDVTEDVTNGNIYVSEYGDSGKITLLKPKSIAPKKGVVTLSPAADSYIRDGSSVSANYGTATNLDVKGSSTSGNNRRTYIRFNVDNTSVGKIKNISSVKLRIYGHNTSGTSSVTVSAFGISGDSWTETGITWNNAPAIPSTALSTVAVNNATKYYEIDVTNFVKQQISGDKKASFALKDKANKGSTLTFNSRQNSSFKPQLVLTGDTVITSLSRTPVNAVITNTQLAAGRAPGNDSPAPLIRQNAVAGKVPSCDEPADFYALADTTTLISPVIIEPAGIQKVPVNSAVKKNAGKPTLYPNPSHRIFHLQFPENYQGKYRLQMIDPVGRLYELGTAILQRGGSVITIDICRMPLKRGLYFIRIFADARSTDVLKLLVQ